MLPSSAYAKHSGFVSEVLIGHFEKFPIIKDTGSPLLHPGKSFTGLLALLPWPVINDTPKSQVTDVMYVGLSIALSYNLYTCQMFPPISGFRY